MPVIPESDQNRQGSAAGLLLEEPSPVVAECGVFLLRKRSAISTEQYLRYGAEASCRSKGLQRIFSGFEAAEPTQTQGAVRIEYLDHGFCYYPYAGTAMIERLSFIREKKGPEQPYAAPDRKVWTYGYAAVFISSGIRVSGSISGSCGIISGSGDGSTAG